MKKIFLLPAFLLCSSVLLAQDDELQRMADSLDALNSQTKEFTGSAFKGTRLINFPTNETVGKHGLDFRIQHRFGEFNDQSGNPAYNAFGLDGGACIRLSLDYGISDRLMVGLGRTSIDKLVDASFKYRITRQTTDNAMPLSITWQSGMNYTFQKDPNKAVNGIDKYHYPVDRISYTNCLVICRRFSDRLSLEFNTFYVHYNIVDHWDDKNDMFGAGISGRFKCTSHMAITFEYARRLNKYSSQFDTYHDPLGIGIDLETGGHVFQLHFTNQFGMNEAQYLPYTTSNWAKVGVRLGFNISRVFAIGHNGGNGY